MKFQRALSLLTDAAEYAERTSGDPWEFAVEIRQLRELGLSANDLRFLVRLQYVVHAHEVKVVGNDGRQFRPTGDLYFTNRTCFVLTPAGIAATTSSPDGSDDQHPVLHSTIRLSNNPVRDCAAIVPTWDAERRTLLFGGRIVKQFKWHARNQEMVLSVFQEESWPVRIDDPLAPSPALDIKRRLSDTIKCLNRKQKNKLIHFRGDGTGQGVIWEFATCHYANGTLG